MMFSSRSSPGSSRGDASGCPHTRATPGSEQDRGVLNGLSSQSAPSMLSTRNQAWSSTLSPLPSVLSPAPVTDGHGCHLSLILVPLECPAMAGISLCLLCYHELGGVEFKKIVYKGDSHVAEIATWHNCILTRNQLGKLSLCRMTPD